MRSHFHILSALFTALVLVGCSEKNQACDIDTTEVLSWSDYNFEIETEHPFAARYQGCGKILTYIAAKHSNDPQSNTFKIVQTAFDEFQPDFVIVEGFPADYGISPARMVDYAKNVKAGPRDAEPFLAIRLADEIGAKFIGGEATDQEILLGVKAQGMTVRDLFGAYVLRQIEQWRRGERISNHTDPRLDAEIKKYVPIFVEDVGGSNAGIVDMASLEGFSNWYKSVNGLDFTENFRPEDAYPVGATETPRATNRLTDTLSDVREKFILEKISSVARGNEKLLVVYGGSHHTVHARALSKAFGEPTITKP